MSSLSLTSLVLAHRFSVFRCSLQFQNDNNVHNKNHLKHAEVVVLVVLSPVLAGQGLVFGVSSTVS